MNKIDSSIINEIRAKTFVCEVFRWIGEDAIVQSFEAAIDYQLLLLEHDEKLTDLIEKVMDRQVFAFQNFDGWPSLT